MRFLIFALILLNVGCGSDPEVLKGEKGDTGSIGPSGIAGMTVSSNRQCIKSDGVQNLIYIYQVLTFTSGDKFIECSVQSSGAQFSSSQYYTSSQQGAITSSCMVGADKDTSSFGSWNFKTTSGVESLIYSDSGSASNGYSYVFLSSDCVTH